MDTLDLLYKHASPAEESSYAKGIPMKYLKQVQEDLKHDNATKVFMYRVFGGYSFRYMFRGGDKYKTPANNTGYHKRPSAFCHKAMADTFTIYEKGGNNWLQ